MATASNVTVTDLLAHTAWARRLARSLTADADAADDLVQETLIAATQHPPATDRPLRPWLAVVLRNLFIKRRLGEQRRAARHAQVATGVVLSADALLEKVEAQRLLAELIAALEEPYRQTVILRYFDDLSAAEIARRLQIPAGTVRWRLKAALDELRKRLDERQGRERWMAALLPLAGARRARAWRWVLAAGTVAVVVASFVVMRSPARPRAELTRAPSLPASARPPSTLPPLLVAAPKDLGACRKEVGRLRAETAAAEVERLKRLNGKALFPLGAANPAAAAALTPAIDRILRGARGSAPPYVLECRTWACRMLVAQTQEEEKQTNEWQGPLQRDEEMQERTSGMGFHGTTPTKDPLTGVGLAQKEVFFTLADPSGQRIPFPHKPPAPAVTTAPLPATLPQCAAEAETLRAQLETARDQIEAHLSPMERFNGGALPDPELAREFRANIVAKLGGVDTSALDLECRNLVCRGKWENAPRNWYNEFFREPWFRKMTDGMMVGREVYFVMARGPRADGMGFLMDLIKRFEAGRAPDDCAARFPATGTLKVKFHLPRTGEPNDDGEVGRISAVYGDALAGTPLANCLEEAIARDILPAPLPDLPVGGAVVYRRLKFPRSPEELISQPR